MPHLEEREDEEFVYEKEYIVLDTSAENTSSIASSASAGGIKLIGMDTPTPYLRVGTMVFKGKHDVNVGTDMIFVAGKSGEKELVALSEKKTLFSRVMLQRKK